MMEFEERRKEVTNMEENTGKQEVVKGGEWMDERTDGCRERKEGGMVAAG